MSAVLELRGSSFFCIPSADNFINGAIFSNGFLTHEKFLLGVFFFISGFPFDNFDGSIFSMGALSGRVCFLQPYIKNIHISERREGKIMYISIVTQYLLEKCLSICPARKKFVFLKN